MAQSKHHGLTVNQRKFVTEYAKDGNGTQAAIRAGYSAKGASVAAARLLKNDSVFKAIEGLHQKIQESGELSAAKVLADIEDVRIKAMESGGYAAALKASELQGKALKMWFENHQVEHKHAGQTDEQLRARLAQLGALDVVGTPQDKRPPDPEAHVTH